MIPKGIPVIEAAMWSIFTSLPQPLMAVPAAIFVRTFAQALCPGLGFAAGAMLWVGFTELLMEAIQESGWKTSISACGVGAAMMATMQVVVKGATL
jgi:ZIP family zinc transporter